LTRQEINALKQLANNSIKAPSSQPGQGASKSARRRRNKRQNGSEMNRSLGPIPLMTSPPTANNLFMRPSRKTLGTNISMPKLSEPGEKFLRGAFAAPDFAGQGNFLGIPDEKSYVQVPWRHIYTGDLWQTLLNYVDADIVKKASRVVIIQAPIPGYAFWFCCLNTGDRVESTTILYGVPYDEFGTLFNNPPSGVPTNDVNSSINEFRFASNSIELICTSNATLWRGSLRAFKTKLSYMDTNAYQPNTNKPEYSVTKAITGVEGVNATAAATFITPSNLGVYMTAVNAQTTFNTSAVPDFMYNINGNNTTSFGIFNGLFTGFGDLETNIIVLEGNKTADMMPDASSATQYQIRAWSLIEYVPTTTSLLYQVAKPSPVYDPAAMSIYKSLVQELPVAVTYFENDSFWKRLLGVIGKVGGWLSNIPGPIGLISGGVGSLAGNIGNLIN
jgi:hypothetical protein